MITQINNSADAIAAFNENLSDLLAGKRKLPFVKEVNNTIGKLTSIIKMELMYKMLTGDRSNMDWFSNHAKGQVTIMKEKAVALPASKKKKTA